MDVHIYKPLICKWLRIPVGRILDAGPELMEMHKKDFHENPNFLLNHLCQVCIVY